MRRFTAGEQRGHGYNSSHSAVFDSMALTLSLSFPIWNKGMWWKGFHVVMSAAWSLDGWWGLTSVICGERGGIYDDHIIVYQGFWR